MITLLTLYSDKPKGSLLLKALYQRLETTDLTNLVKIEPFKLHKSFLTSNTEQIYQITRLIIWVYSKNS